MCHFTKLFIKRSLGTGNSNSDTYLINSCLTIIEEWLRNKWCSVLNWLIRLSDIVNVSVVSDASVCELGPDQQRCSILEVDSQQQVCAQKL